jgi:hypothetical protein
MRILFSGEKYLMPAGGAVKSMRTLLDLLNEEGNEVHTVFCGVQEIDHEKDGIILHERVIPLKYRYLKSTIRHYFLNRWWTKVLRRLLLKEQFDLIFTQQYLIPSTVKVAWEHKTKVYSFIRDYFPIHLGNILKKEKLPLIKKIIYPFSFIVKHQHIKALQNSHMVIANGMFISQWYYDKADVDSYILYPIVK